LSLFDLLRRPVAASQVRLGARQPSLACSVVQTQTDDFGSLALRAAAAPLLLAAPIMV